MAPWSAQQPGRMQLRPSDGARTRLRALAWFFLALIYAIFAQQFSSRTAGTLLRATTAPLAGRLVYVLFLLIGFAAMGAFGQGQQAPVQAMGLVRRPGWFGEWLLGVKFGWGAIVACVLPVALTGSLLVTFNDRSASVVGSLLLDLFTLLLAVLADELVFRGYPFQRLIEVTGPGLASVLMAVLFAASRGAGGAESLSGTLNTLLLGLLLAMAYLRTRALWVAWGLHFAWLASMALLFGLPAAGLFDFSPVISTYTTGPAWLTGGGYGPSGSGVATAVLLTLLVLLTRATRDLRHRWAHDEIVAAGVPVDVDAIARAQHEAATRESRSTAGNSLVQILPAERPNNENSRR